MLSDNSDASSRRAFKRLIFECDAVRKFSALFLGVKRERNPFGSGSSKVWGSVGGGERGLKEKKTERRKRKKENRSEN